jgi:hypothetical protein
MGGPPLWGLAGNKQFSVKDGMVNMVLDFQGMIEFRTSHLPTF